VKNGNEKGKIYLSFLNEMNFGGRSAFCGVGGRVFK